MSRRSERRHKLRKKRRREHRALNRQYPEYELVGTVSGRFSSTPEPPPGVDALPMSLREFARLLFKTEKGIDESEAMQAGLRVHKAIERGEYPLPPVWQYGAETPNRPRKLVRCYQCYRCGARVHDDTPDGHMVPCDHKEHRPPPVPNKVWS